MSINSNFLTIHVNVSFAYKVSREGQDQPMSLNSAIKIQINQEF